MRAAVAAVNAVTSLEGQAVIRAIETCRRAAACRPFDWQPADL